MSVYEKLFNVRNQFYQSARKKTGDNKYYKYFELKDILLDAVEACKEQKLLGIFSIAGDDNGKWATLTFTDIENPKDTVVFSAPFVASAPLNANDKKTMNDMQAVGAAITYYRRFLWAMAMELIEKDETEAQYKPDLGDIHIAFGDCSTLDELKKIYGDEYRRLKSNHQDTSEIEALYKKHKARLGE